MNTIKFDLEDWYRNREVEPEDPRDYDAELKDREVQDDGE